MTNLRPAPAPDFLPVYQDAFRASRVPPLLRVSVSDLPRRPADISLSAACTCRGESVWHTAEKSFRAFDARTFSPKYPDTAVFTFSFEDFTFDGLLEVLADKADGEITVTLSVDGIPYSSVTPVTLRPRGEWQGAGMHPEAFAAFVESESRSVAAFTADLAASDASVFEKAEQLVKKIRSRGFVCAVRPSFTPEKRQKLRSPDSFLDRGASVLTACELAALFAACAERLALDPVVAFARTAAGDSFVFCGVRVARTSPSSALSESLSRLSAELADGRTLLFDPATLCGGQNIRLGLACENAAARLARSGTELLFVLDVALARRDGVRPFSNEAPLAPEGPAGNARDALAARFTALSSRPVFDLLDGRYDAYPVLPLITPDLDALFNASADGFTVDPLNVSDHPEVFAGLDENLCRFAMRAYPPRSYNKAELDKATALRDGFKSRVAASAHVPVGLYEQKFHECASRIAFGDPRRAPVWIVFGFLRVADEDGVRFLPLCFAEAEASYLHRYAFRRKANLPLVFNTALAMTLGASVDSLSGLTALDEVFEAAAALAEKYKNAEVAVLREAAVVRADLTDFLLWQDIAVGGKHMLHNPLVTGVLTGKSVPAGEKLAPQVLFEPDDTVADVLTTTGVSVVTGLPVDEKFDLFALRTAFELCKARRIITVTSSDDFAVRASKALDDCGLGDAALWLGEVPDTASLIADIKQKIALVGDVVPVAAGENTADLAAAREKLAAFTEACRTPEPSLDLAYFDAAGSYFAAAGGLAKRELLPLAPDALNRITPEAFDSLFDAAERLLTLASRVNKGAGLAESTPLCRHPLASLDPASPPTAETGQTARSLVEKILPGLANYRETFYEIGPSLGIASENVRTVPSLAALNELFRLIIVSRELPGVDALGERDVVAFAMDADRRAGARARLEAIETRLSFFERELFDDVDNLLSDYDYGEGAKKGGFLKKFLFKRSGRDVLSPYVKPDMRAAFASADLAETYKYLAEYRRIRATLAVSGESAADETLKLASAAKAVTETLCKIDPAFALDDAALSRRAAAAFSLMARLNDDPALFRRLTAARAGLAEILSDEECLLANLKKLLGANLSELSFERGVLSYDGLSAYLTRLTDHLPLVGDWYDLLAVSRANPALAAFSNYLFETGLAENTDRLFAASLLLPALETIAEKREVSADGRLYPARAIESFGKLCDKARDGLFVRAADTCRASLAHYISTANLSPLFGDADLPLAVFAAKYRETLLAFYPCLIVPRRLLVGFTGGKIAADTVFAENTGFAFTENSDALLAALSAAPAVMLFDFTNGRDPLVRTLGDCGGVSCTLRARTSPVFAALARFSSASPVTAPSSGENMTLLFVNGTMRRSGDMANPAEAELALARASALAKEGKRVGVFAFTTGEYAYLNHLFHLALEKDKTLRPYAGSIRLYETAAPVFDTVDEAIVTFGAAADKNGTAGRYFGFDRFTEALSFIASAAPQNVTFIASLGAGELEKLQSASLDASKLCGFLNYAADGTLPVAFGDFPADTVSEPVLARLVSGGEDRLASCGAYDCGADAVEPAKKTAYLLLCTPERSAAETLLVRARLEKNGVTAVLVTAKDLVP